MSAFLVQPGTMSRVIDLLLEQHHRPRVRSVSNDPDGKLVVEYEPDEFAGVPIRHRMDTLAGTRLAQKLYALNIEAVSQRYPYDTFDSMPGPCDKAGISEYQHEDRQWHYDPLQHYAALSCLIYQCSEGSVPETALYRDLCEAQRRLACEIISTRVPEAEKAGWDFAAA